MQDGDSVSLSPLREGLSPQERAPHQKRWGSTMTLNCQLCSSKSLRGASRTVPSVLYPTPLVWCFWDFPNHLHPSC